MLLAGDIGGTKTLLGLFGPETPRPRPTAVTSFETIAYKDLPSLICAFIERHSMSASKIEAACFGLAGPVVGESVSLTNVPWRIDAASVADRFNIPHVALLNDLQAMAYAVPVLEDAELTTLQPGEAVRDGNMALIAAGTGLGEALLHAVQGRFVPSPSEGGHADFAARTEREVELLRDLTTRLGRAEVEQVVSGPGLVHLHRLTHRDAPCAALIGRDDPDAPAAISQAALDRRCGRCIEALDMFVDAYGAEAGNLALRSVSTGGFFIGGGIAPKIMPALAEGRFMRAFRSKKPLDTMLARMPVHVILNAEAGLVGAAVYAAEFRREAVRDR
jgi:glucokinase